MMTIRYADKIPYVFVLDHLNGVDILIKPMFGYYGIYAHGRLYLFLVSREKPIRRHDINPMQNGIYIATTTEHCTELRVVFPQAEFQMLKAGKVWIFVSELLDRFEEYTIAACEMISRSDHRIGR